MLHLNSWYLIEHCLLSFIKDANLWLKMFNLVLFWQFPRVIPALYFLWFLKEDPSKEALYLYFWCQPQLIMVIWIAEFYYNTKANGRVALVHLLVHNGSKNLNEELTI